MSVFDNMLHFVKSAWPARSFIVPCLEGPPGIGKTAAIKQAAEELREQGATGKVVTIIASQILPNEVSGITMPVPEEKAMEIFDHYRLSSLRDGDILFFDELLEADQMVLSACLTLIESRQLMSGNELPDIMIVAATNPSIKAQMLKVNIRQRFMWQSFRVDKTGTAEYIKRTYGFDVRRLTSYIVEDGPNYNVLTPRSFTKLVAWIDSAADDAQAKQIACEINGCWDSEIGTELYNLWRDKYCGAETQLRKAVTMALSMYADIDEVNKLHDHASIEEFIDEASITELMEMLQSLDGWEQIEEYLSSVTVEEE